MSRRKKTFGAMVAVVVMVMGGAIVVGAQSSDVVIEPPAPTSYGRPFGQVLQPGEISGPGMPPLPVPGGIEGASASAAASPPPTAVLYRNGRYEAIPQPGVTVEQRRVVLPDGTVVADSHASVGLTDPTQQPALGIAASPPPPAGEVPAQGPDMNTTN